MHRAYILLGSNIHPDINNPKALELLEKRNLLVTISGIWQIKTIASEGPDFLNVAVLIETLLTHKDLKRNVLHSIEKALRRTKGKNEYSPRTIDLDIVVFDNEVIELDIWEYGFMVLPLAEILPDLRNPKTGDTLKQIAQRIQILSPVNNRLSNNTF